MCRKNFLPINEIFSLRKHGSLSSLMNAILSILESHKNINLRVCVYIIEMLKMDNVKKAFFWQMWWRMVPLWKIKLDIRIYTFFYSPYWRPDDCTHANIFLSRSSDWSLSDLTTVDVQEKKIGPPKWESSLLHIWKAIWKICDKRFLTWWNFFP